MNNSKLFIENLYTEGAEIVFHIESKTKQNKEHIVAKKNGKWNCSCIANRMGNECSHIKMIIKETNEDKKCFFCGITWWAANGLEPHHLYRKSLYPETIGTEKEIRIWLCREHHNMATNDAEFENNLIKTYKLKYGK